MGGGRKSYGDGLERDYDITGSKERAHRKNAKTSRKSQKVQFQRTKGSDRKGMVGVSRKVSGEKDGTRKK